MLHNINPWTPLFSERRGGGKRAPKEREKVSKKLTTAPPSFQLCNPPSFLLIPSFSLSSLAIQPSAPIGWIMMAISPAPLSKQVQLYTPLPQGSPPLLAFANFLPSPRSNPQHYNPQPHPGGKSLTPGTGSVAKKSYRSRGQLSRHGVQGNRRLPSGTD